MRKYINIGFAILILALASVAQTLAQTCTPAAPDLVSWYSGDGDALDSRSRNNKTLGARSQFAAGKVGQAFQTIQTSGGTVTVPDSASLDFTNAFTIEMWAPPTATGSPTGSSFIACKGDWRRFSRKL